jgi:3-deoxy-7-phosphoheptulonate synthase
MPHRPLENLNIAAFDLMPSPEEIHARVPISDKAAEIVFDGRETIKRILDRKDPRLFIVIGPCSIHDLNAGYDYAQRLKRLANEVCDTLYLVMRVYFEKPRTSVGWKGFINDPRMDDSFHIEEGMEKARTFLLQVNELGLPAATEALDQIAHNTWATSFHGRRSRAHLGIPDPSGNGVRLVHTGRLQEWHGWQYRRGHQCDQVRPAAP